MVKLALILYQIYISFSAAGLRAGTLKGGYKRGLPFFGNARFYVIGAGAPATVCRVMPWAILKMRFFNMYTFIDG